MAKKADIEKCWEQIKTQYGRALMMLAKGPDDETEESEGEDSPSEEN